MEKYNGTEFHLLGEKLTHYPNQKIYPCIQPLDYKKYDDHHHILSFDYHEKAARTVHFISHCQIVSQKNLE